MTALAVTREYQNFGTALADLNADLTQAASTTLDITNSGDLILVIYNGTGGNITATLEGQTDRQGNAVADKAVTIGTLDHAILFFFNTEQFNLLGIAQVTLSTTTTVKVGLYRLRKAT